jgi:short-subunit dehydrogenase
VEKAEFATFAEFLPFYLIGGGGMSFKGQVVILTGASEGIGRALALQIAEPGLQIVICGRNAARLDDLKKALEAKGAGCITVAGDLAERSECQRAVETAVKTYGRIDTLINNAGITMWANFEDTTDPSLIEHVMRVNFLSAANCTHYALPYLIKSRGRIAAVASIAGILGVPGHAIYGASKHAMMGFFNSLRVELKAKGVSVTMIAPDFVKTEIHMRGLDASGKAMGKRIDDKNMSAGDCARLMAKAISKRQRLLITSARGKLAYTVRDLLPGLVDIVSLRSVKSHSLLD